MNSFNFAAKGIEREIARQIRIYEAGGTVDQETLHFDPGNEESAPMRSKEEAQDYRYFPEPDLVPVHPPDDLVERLRGEIGELPGARIGRIADTLSFYDADVLVTGGLDRLWVGGRRRAAPTRRKRRTCLRTSSSPPGSHPRRSTPAELAKLVAARGEIPRATFDEALAHVGRPGLQRRSVRRAEGGLGRRRELDPVIDRVIEANPAQAEQYRGGKQGLLGFFVGQVMKETGGKADARVVNERVREKLRRTERSRCDSAGLRPASSATRRASRGTSRRSCPRPRGRSAARAARSRRRAARPSSCRTCSVTRTVSPAPTLIGVFR